MTFHLGITIVAAVLLAGATYWASKQNRLWWTLTFNILMWLAIIGIFWTLPS